MSLLLKNAQAALEGGHMGIERIHIGMLRTDGGTQMRAALDDATVQEYADAIIAGATFPAIIAYYDGTDYWLADGFHRIAAHKLVHQRSKTAWGEVEVDVRSGTRRDAILHAAGANADHGLRRTNADKRRAVESLLRDPEWSQWSDREIARRCHVDHKTVGSIRAEMVGTGEIPQLDERRTADGRTMNTANIGANPPRAITYGALCLLIEREIAPTCDLWPADMDWLVQYVSDAIHRKNMTASEQDIMTAIIDTREDLRSRQERENRLIRAIAAAEAADAERAEKSQEEPHTPDHGQPETTNDARLTYNQRMDLVKRYWSKRELDYFATLDNPIPEIRRYIVDYQNGSVDGTWRISTGQGKVLAWLKLYGDYWDREPDGVFSYSAFAKVTAAFLPPRQSAANEQPAVERSNHDHDPYDHDNPDAILNDLAAMDSAHEPDPAAQEHYRLTLIERALLELARSFGRGRFSITVNLGDEGPEWAIRAWEPGYPMEGTAHLYEAVSALREQLSTVDGS